jgi:hypothetical protein
MRTRLKDSFGIMSRFTAKPVASKAKSIGTSGRYIPVEGALQNLRPRVCDQKKGAEHGIDWCYQLHRSADNKAKRI